MLYHFTRIVVKLGTELLCRIDAPDLDHIPRQGPLIVISNHTGQLEVPVFFGQLANRPVTAWAKVESWDNFFLRWLFDLWGLIPVRRGEADPSALRDALKALEKGYLFGIAPEGTRNKSGRLKRAHPGAMMLALHSGAPIVPVAHWGGENFLHNLRRLRRTDFHIRVGKPFTLDLRGMKPTREVRQQIADEMMLRIAELMPARYHGEYANISLPEKPFTRTIEMTEKDL
jgi:1-acyl-sn-glycerol-3-phosphate acyltransferase